MNYESVSKIIADTIEKHSDLLGIDANKVIDTSTVLYGDDGLLDSLSLVHLIVEIEKAINLKSSKQISLSDAKAFSQQKSPFQSVDSLANFALSRLV